jgi:hypothetical protein
MLSPVRSDTGFVILGGKIGLETSFDIIETDKFLVDTRGTLANRQYGDGRNISTCTVYPGSFSTVNLRRTELGTLRLL